MTRPEPTFRRATPADAVAFYGTPAKMSFRGFVAELDGEVVGIGGVYYDNGVPIAFSEMRPPMRKYKKAMAKACRILTRFFDQLGGKVYAIACPTEPTAPYLLAKLGFKPTGLIGPHGETLVRG